MSAYYNEIDPKKAAWLRELIAVDLIVPGEVDERSITDVKPDELIRFRQCHFFAGIGVWSYALRLAGWPDDAEAWTGSCPCQPFSAAGKRAGFADGRHLWPEWFRLISERRPVACFGEQVASADGLTWFDLVHDDLEGAAYTVGSADLCSAGFGAPHIRQRLFFVADASSERRQQNPGGGAELACGMGDPKSTEWRPDSVGRNNDSGQARQWNKSANWTGKPGPVNGFWGNAEWIYCRDEKYRAIEPGTFPLAHGAPARVGRLRGYGDAINAEAAAEFIGAFMEATA